VEAVIYICHGSRMKEASEQASSFVKKCMGDLYQHVPIQEYCFLELAEPTIEEGFRRCIDQGATTISVLPVLLLTAAHAKIDIPEVLAKMQDKYPGVEINYGRPIGVHEKMIDILVERVSDTNVEVTSNSMILLVGRGSSDLDVKTDLSALAAMLEKRLMIKEVVPCYLTAAKPSFEEALEYAKNRSCEHVFVIPYLLFTGVLMKSMEATIKKLTKENGKNYILCDYLGYHPLLEEVIQERVLELIKKKIID